MNRRVALQATTLLHAPIHSRSHAINTRLNNDTSSALAYTYTTHHVTLLWSLKHKMTGLSAVVSLMLRAGIVGTSGSDGINY